MQCIVTRRSETARDALEAFWALEDIVYPNGFDGPPELETVEWADPEWDVFVHDDDGLLVAHAGVLVREARLDGVPVRIAGLAEMLTHPEHRRQGYGAAALRESGRLMHDETQAAFALLVCPQAAVPFYASLGWQRFNGQVQAEVEAGMAAFAESAWLVLPVHDSAPTDGLLDLQGTPW